MCTGLPEHCNRNRGSCRLATVIDNTDSACGNDLKCWYRNESRSIRALPPHWPWYSKRKTVKFKDRQSKTKKRSPTEAENKNSNDIPIILAATTTMKQTECVGLQHEPLKPKGWALVKPREYLTIYSGKILESDLWTELQQNFSEKNDRLDAEVAWAHNLLNESPEKDVRRWWRLRM